MEKTNADDSLEDLQWLVSARNRVQTLLLRLYENWDTQLSFRRQEALAGVFSLWRAVFLLVNESDAGQPIDRIDDAAKGLLNRVIRTNAINFGDDLRMRRWSSVYYVGNAIARIRNLNPDAEFTAYGTSPVGSVRDAWEEAYLHLDGLIPGGARTTVIRSH